MSEASPEAAIESLRARGAQAFDPVRFRFIEALARRSVALGGEPQQLLNRRLEQLLADYVDRFEKVGPQSKRVEDRDSSALKQLLDHVAQHDAAGPAGSPGELKTLRYFRSTWSRLRVNQRLTQSLAKLPENAGPLNSHGLALRSLELMRDVSPQYLDRFMVYVDALMWLDQATGGGAREQKDVVRAEGERKRKNGRGKSG